MQSPNYIEDWILLLNGQLDSKLNPMMGHHSTGPVRLTDRDAKFLESVANAIHKDIGLSHRQLAAAQRIIARYQPQLASRGYDVVDLHLVPQRLPLRAVDRSSWVEFNAQTQQYRLRFPYHTELINFLYNQVSNAIGKFAWNSTERIWEVDANEHNLMILMQFMLHPKNTYNYKFCSNAQMHFDTAADVMENPTRYLPHIELCDDQLQLCNGTPALHDALLQDGFTAQSDPVLWAFRSHKYGIDTGQNLQLHVRKLYPAAADAILINKAQTLADHNKYNGIQYGTLFEMMKIFPNQHWIFTVNQENFDKNGMFSRFVKTLGVEDKITILTYNNWSWTNIPNFVDIPESIVVSNVSTLMHRGNIWFTLSKRCMKYLFLFDGN